MNVIMHQSTNEDFFLVYHLQNIPTTYMLVRKLNRYTRKDNKYTPVGKKMNLSIIVQYDIFYKKLSSLERLGYYKFSYHISHLLMKENHILGTCHYYYNYAPKYHAFQSATRACSDLYVYINYHPCKPIKSVAKYISSQSSSDLLVEQNANSPPDRLFHTQFCLDKPSLLWTGIIIYPNLLNDQYKQILYNHVWDWIDHQSYGHKQISLNRIKLFLYFYYIFGQDYFTQSTADKTACGLRWISNPMIPEWMLELIIYLKKNGFLPPKLEINQIGVNVYWNENEKDLAFSQISPHTEGGKFSCIYSLSIYNKNFDGFASLSFSLKQNYSNGDLKIPLQDCCGLELRS